MRSFVAKDTNVNLMTVSHPLNNEISLKSYKPARKPCLNTAMKFNRLDAAKKYKDWTAEQRSNDLSSDESLVQQFVVRTRIVKGRHGTYLMKSTQFSQQRTRIDRLFWVHCAIPARQDGTF